jgi:hypothetical protein
MTIRWIDIQNNVLIGRLIMEIMENKKELGKKIPGGSDGEHRNGQGKMEIHIALCPGGQDLHSDGGDGNSTESITLSATTATEATTTTPICFRSNKTIIEDKVGINIPAFVDENVSFSSKCRDDPDPDDPDVLSTVTLLGCNEMQEGDADDSSLTRRMMCRGSLTPASPTTSNRVARIRLIRTVCMMSIFTSLVSEHH